METRIEHLSPKNPDELNRFVQLERKLLHDKPYYVSDIDVDVAFRLSGASAFFHDALITLYICQTNGQPVGRCAAMVLPRHQAAKGESVGFIGYFAASDGQTDAIVQMLAEAEAWLRAQGVTRVIAPYNGSPLFGYGVMIEGFDQESWVPMGWNPIWYDSLFRAAGYRPKYPLWYYTIDLTSEAYANANRLTTRNRSVKVRKIRKGHWHEDLEIIRRLIALTFTREWEFTELTGDEMREYFDAQRPYLSREQLLIAEVDGHTAGFCIGQPNRNAIMRSFQGSLGLINAVKLKHEMHRFDGAGLIMIGVLREFRGMGVARSLAVNLYRHYAQHGQTRSGYYYVNDQNASSRAFAESIGGQGSIQFMCYDKEL